jgi:hypothetical protein
MLLTKLTSTQRAQSKFEGWNTHPSVMEDNCFFLGFLLGLKSVAAVV